MAGVGTGGTVSGVGEALKMRDPSAVSYTHLRVDISPQISVETYSAGISYPDYDR